ncbi:MAG: response regulator transcription factor [Bacteroidales bacterium]|jgi:DNA-binding NarL/FixJ family response regulator|nr:response regulator transcription factor [Bacteroidales bacterium]
MISVTIIEPSFIIRQGLVSALSGYRDIEIHKVYDEFDNIEGIINKIDTDIAVLNPSSIDQISLAKLIEGDSEFFKKRVVLFTNFPVGVDLESSVRAVFSYNQSETDIVKGINKLVSEFNTTEEPKEEVLSKREQDILRLIALGKTQKEIADELFISTHTVVSHRKNITRKLGIKTVSGLTVYAILNNLISMGELQ